MWTSQWESSNRALPPFVWEHEVPAHTPTHTEEMSSAPPAAALQSLKRAPFYGCLRWVANLPWAPLGSADSAAIQGQKRTPLMLERCDNEFHVYSPGPETPLGAACSVFFFWEGVFGLMFKLVDCE